MKDCPLIFINDNALILTRDWTSHFDSLKKHLSKAKEDYKKFRDKRSIFNVKYKVWLKRYYFTNEIEEEPSH